MKMTVWSKVSELDRYAVAIHHFSNADEGLASRLALEVGDLVEAEREYGDWYYGHRVKEPSVRGMYPKSYVCTRRCSIDRIGSEVHINVSHSPIVHEITQTLKEWAILWKQLYLAQDEKFKFIEVSMRTLLELRKEIISGNLPQDKLKKIEKTAIYTMDKGNRTLGLDLIVRSPVAGTAVDPFEFSMCQLNTLFNDTHNYIARILDPSSQTGPPSNPSPSVPSITCYRFFASIRNFIVKMSEDAELLLSLYDGVASRQLTENYVVRWSKSGLASDIDQMHNLKVIFTDLGKCDLRKEKIFLVCIVIRIGGMESHTSESRRSTVSQSMMQTGRILSSLGATPVSCTMRRPFGIAAIEVTKTISCGDKELDDSKQYCVPFYPCEKESLESLLKKIITNKDLKADNKTGQGLWLSMKLLHDDSSKMNEDFISGNTAVARKMGFPEVIMPGDARNDLYITLIGGSFSKGGGKSTDRNIEVTVRVCDQHGNLIPNVISLGGGAEPMNEYTSVVYYHDDRPRWMETFKVCMPIEDFKLAHLLFLFRHRSSNDTKDRSSSHFAIAYIKLLRPDGTTLRDTKHSLALYKIDGKKWPSKESDAASVYLTLQSNRNELPANEKDCKLQKSFLSLVYKDFFEIESNVCSTKLTQNVELLGVLNWQESVRRGELRDALRRLRAAPGDDTVKFLQDLLDALFHILTQVENERTVDDNDESYDVLVYECLLDVFLLVYQNVKYQHFQPVLDVYIEKNFCNALVYKKLIDLLIKHCSTPLSNEFSDETKTKTLRSMKCLECLIRFIVRSRELHAKLTRNSEDHVFHKHLEELFKCIIEMMRWDIDATLTLRGTCIKNLPATLPHLTRVYPAEKLSLVIGEVLDVLPQNRLKERRLNTILDLLHGPLFLDSACRCILLPHITATLRILLQYHDEFPEALSSAKHSKETGGCGVEMRSKNRSVDKVARLLGASRRKLEEHRGYNELMVLCVKTLGELLSLLYRKDVGSIDEEYRIVANDLLYTVVRTTIEMERDYRQYDEDEEKDDTMLRQIVSILFDLLRQMTDKQYSTYIKHFASDGEVLSFLTEIQMVLRELVERPVYRTFWNDMINIQNFVLLNSIRLFTKTLKEKFLEPFERQVWLDWFGLTMVFITQPPLQLERMTQRQRRYLLSKYGDMRQDAAGLLNSMWFTMDHYRRTFIPSLVGPLLEVSLIPEVKVRKLTIPIFFDMMECEYNSSAEGNTMDSGMANVRNFSACENEMIDKLDELVEGGKGDTEWRALFVSIVGSKCRENDNLRESGCQFVAIVGRLMDILLQYRDSHSLASISHRMQVTTHILDFYSEIERPHMYIRYVYKLCAMQEERECWAEAGLVLRLHGALLHWSDAPLAERLRSYRHPDANTHRKLKRALYLDIVEFLRKGKMWEVAIEICKELVTQYENEMFDYIQLSDLYKDMSDLYNEIMTKIRQHPAYFRVAYYGHGFPEFMRNRVFVYRGKEVEKLSDFCDRLMDELPNAELMTKLESPGDDIKNSQRQYVQINAVEPMMSEKQKRLSGKPVSSPILTYYRYNNVDKFYYSRPFHRQDPSEDNSEQDEFATLWIERTELEISDSLPGILCWFPVMKTKTFEMSPLEVAIDSLETSNKSLKALVLEYKVVEDLNLEPLTRKLLGTVEAAVMGGVARYEKVFLTDTYIKSHPQHAVCVEKLKDLIADLVPLLEFGIEIHKNRAPSEILPLHQRIVECFDIMKKRVYDNYGQKSCDLMSEVPVVTMRRRKANSSNSTETRQSTESLGTSRNTNSSLKNAYTTLHEKLQRNSLGNNTSVSSQRGSSVLSTMPRKRDKDKRRNRKAESASQWYTPTIHHNVTPNNSFDASTPVMELRQELTASRPLRSEVEAQRRLSQQRPNSIQSDPNSNRNSIGTTDSNQDEEDPNPPPLPQKSSKIENNNSEEIVHAINTTHGSLTDFSELTRILASRQNYDQVISPRGNMFYSSLQSHRVVKFSNGDIAPTPPPKKRDRPVIQS